MAEAAARSSPRAAATETRVRACGPATISMEKIHQPSPCSVLRVHGPVVIFHKSRKIGDVRSEDDEEPPCLRAFIHRKEVPDLSLFRSYTACRDLIHRMLAEAPVTGKYDLAADNWEAFQPHDVANTIVANVRRDTKDACGVGPVPAYAIDVEMVLTVTLTYSEPKALLLACTGEAAGALPARSRKRRHARETAGEPCAICFLDVETQDKETVTLPCSHSFHSRCIGPWFRRASTCPNCRRDAMDYFVSVRSVSIGGS